MIQGLVGFALRSPVVVLSGVAAVVAAGIFSYRHLDIEAYPNPVPPLVEVITRPSGDSGEEVERYVTIPLEVGLSGMPGLDHIRSQSLFGLSDVKCYFKWGTAYKDARQEVINRLQFVDLPPTVAAKPEISPWNSIGEVYRYTVRGKGYAPLDLKTAQDWTLERQFKQVDGVIDVVGFGGETKQYHVNVDPFRLRGQGATLEELVSSIERSNRNVGGERLSLGEQSYAVRAIGLLRDVRDVSEIVIDENHGIPVRVKDVATVDVGGAPRLGLVGRDGEADVVQGTVLMRYGGETQSVLASIHKKVDGIRESRVLPPGVDIDPYYDRGDLVRVTTRTVLENLLLGMGLVCLVLFLFLGHTRAALITAVNIPLALLVAFSGMVATGTSANLISLGAVDFGIVVDSSVIMMENIFRHLGPHGKGKMRDRILAGAREVANPMTFSTLIIGVAFLPLFTMTGVSGVIFSPMAHTYAFAIGGAILMALTLTPVLSARFIPAQTLEKENAVMRALHRVYGPLFDFAIRRPKVSLFVGLLPVVACGVAFPHLGREFMPKLEEGNFWIRASLPTSVSLEQSAKYVGRMRAIVRGCPGASESCDGANRKYPEVQTVISQLGRPDDGTDVSGFNNIELFAPLKPFDEWRRGMTKEKLTEQLSEELTNAFPGVVFNFSQMISDNVEEALSGVKGENSVKVIGPDVKTNEAVADAIVDAVAPLSGVKDLGVLKSLGQPNIKIVPDRVACARYGLNTGDVEAVVKAAIGGQVVTRVYESEKAFDLTVRWLEPYRSSPRAIREIAVTTPKGQHVPLGQLAEVTEENGPALIYREDGNRYTPVKFSVRGRDLASTITEAQAKVKANVRLPYGTRLMWGGEMDELEQAESRLKVIIPVTFVLIFLLAYAAVRTRVDSLIVLLNLPIACSGGILALLVTGIHFSVSAAMGFISIFGIAIQDAMLVVTYFQRLREIEGFSIAAAAKEAADKRLRPVLMTTLVATLGLLPAAVSNGVGSQTQKPLAVVVIGGSLILALLPRIVQPSMLLLAHGLLARYPTRASRVSVEM